MTAEGDTIDGTLSESRKRLSGRLKPQIYMRWLFLLGVSEDMQYKDHVSLFNGREKGPAL